MSNVGPTNDTGDGGSAGVTPVSVDELEGRINKMVEEGDGGTPTTPTPEAGTTQIPSSGEPPISGDGKGSQTQPVGQQPQPGAVSTTPADPIQPLTQQQRLTSDEKGNLVDGKGNVVANAGKERRLWERVQRFEHFEVPQLQQQISELTNTAAQAQVLNNVPRQLGLSDEDAMQGLKLIASYKKDPVATIQYILTEARAAGHNVQAENQGQVDLAAVSRLLDDRLSPLLEDRATQQRTIQADAEAAKQYRDFTTRFPDAVMHEDIIAGILQRDKTMSPDAAYYQLRLWAQERSLNWNQPLKPQIDAAAQQGGTQKPVIPAVGGGRGGNAPIIDTTQAASVAGADADTGDIVKQAMREAGMNPD